MIGRITWATNGRGALLILAVLFLSSGMLRLWDGAGVAIAREIASLDPSAESTASGQCEGDPGVAAALAAIRTREVELERREAVLLDRARALEVAEATVMAQLEDLEAAEQSLLATISLSETAAEDDLARLTSVYENMKPKEATPLFAQMDPEFAAGFLGRMRSDAAAAILAGLDPELGYSISVLLASRNAGAPVE